MTDEIGKPWVLHPNKQHMLKEASQVLVFYIVENDMKMPNNFPKERSDPTAVATAKCLKSIVLKALANGQQILEALHASHSK